MADTKRKSIIELLTGKPSSEGAEEAPSVNGTAVNVTHHQKHIKTPHKETVEVNDVIERALNQDTAVEKSIVNEIQEGQLTVDVGQTDKYLIIKSTLAGVDPKDLDISLNNDVLTIRGKRQTDEESSKSHYYYREIFWGTFSRTIILPVEVNPEKVDATLKNGVLTVKLLKKFEERNKKIEVKSE